jgi:hypothetical protein
MNQTIYEQLLQYVTPLDEQTRRALRERIAMHGRLGAEMAGETAVKGGTEMAIKGATEMAIKGAAEMAVKGAAEMSAARVLEFMTALAAFARARDLTGELRAIQGKLDAKSPERGRLQKTVSYLETELKVLEASYRLAMDGACSAATTTNGSASRSLHLHLHLEE